MLTNKLDDLNEAMTFLDFPINVRIFGNKWHLCKKIEISDMSVRMFWFSLEKTNCHLMIAWSFTLKLHIACFAKCKSMIYSLKQEANFFFLASPPTHHLACRKVIKNFDTFAEYSVSPNCLFNSSISCRNDCIIRKKRKGVLLTIWINNFKY